MLLTTIEYHRILSVRRVMRRCSTAHSRRARVIRTHHDPRRCKLTRDARDSDLSPPPSFLSPSQVEEFYVLTWEAPKEMIFEMPVRNFSLPDPRGITARRRSRAAPVLS